MLEESYDPVSTEAVASTISCTLAMRFGRDFGPNQTLFTYEGEILDSTH
jgi:hypothetical protein